MSWQPTELVRRLRSATPGMTGLNALKTRYRPYICPLEWVLAEIPEQARLYDIGCGTGALLLLARQCRHARLAHGYDIDPRAVSASRYLKAAAGDEFQVSMLPVSQTPPNLAEYDTITMIDVLHHIPPAQQQDFLNRLVANMAPGSRLVFKDIDAAQPIGAAMNQLHDLLLAREWVHPRSRQATVRMLEQAGLQVHRQATRWTLWYPHFLVVAEKPTGRLTDHPEDRNPSDPSCL